MSVHYDSTTKRITGGEKTGQLFLIGGLMFSALSGLGYFMNAGQFFYSWLVAFIFWTTIGLGALFFILVHYLAHSIWSVVIRRVAETIMIVLPWLVIFFLPILFGMHELYHWTHKEVVMSDAILLRKSAYLNTTFFIIRAAFYFTVWFFLTRIMYRKSLAQDDGEETTLYRHLRPIAAPGMFLFAITLTFSAFDWVMSLDPHWYSTIFGVYIFAGAFVTIFAAFILLLLALNHHGIMTEEVTIEHYHDLGKFLFAFTVFWTYIAGAQYFLIWYGNIPEETVWFIHRWEGSWKYVSLFLMAGHFAIPFLILLFRASKRNLRRLGVMAGLIFVMHYVDLYWLIMPEHFRDGVSPSWMDITSWLGIGGIFLYVFWRNFTAHAVLPIKDRYLTKSMKFVNQ
ncbi:MAG: hypothetical protein ACE5D8_03650 [Fidelibacterota bacterium]